MILIKHRRVLLKLSGETVGGAPEGQGIDWGAAEKVAEQIAEGRRADVQIAIVIGGGNLWRGGRDEGLKLERTASDLIGMLATVINSIVLGEALKEQGIPARVMSAIGPSPRVEPYQIGEARKALAEGQVVLIAGGTSNPYFTTDSAAALRALELQAECLLKGTNVDGVYSSDPRRDPSARLYTELTFDEALRKQLQVMDAAAFSLCAQGGIPVLVFNAQRPRGIIEALLGQSTGTRVQPRDTAVRAE